MENDDLKKEMKKQLDDILDMLNNSQEPITEEQKELLNQVSDDVNDFNSYINEIIEANKILNEMVVKDSNNKSYIKYDGKLLDDQGNMYVETTEEKDYSFELEDKNGVKTKYKIYKLTE